MKKILLLIGISFMLSMILAGCKNCQEWQKTIIEDQLKKQIITTVIYKSDTGFDLGTEGLGEYNFIPVSVSGVGK
jgi:uncharacterized lipoprotein YehR (DUF1307 family)